MSCADGLFLLQQQQEAKAQAEYEALLAAEAQAAAQAQAQADYQASLQQQSQSSSSSGSLTDLFGTGHQVSVEVPGQYKEEYNIGSGNGVFPTGK